MLARKNVALTFEVHYIESKVGKTGLTVTVDVWKKTPGVAATEIVTAASATEIGDGLYVYELAASFNDADRAVYTAVFKTATTSVDQRELASLYTVDHTFLAAVDTGSPTFVSAVEGGVLTAYLSRTWAFTNVSAGVSLDDYEALVFSVKKDLRTEADADAILRVHSTSGLERIGGAAPVSSGNGSLSGSGTSFTVRVEDTETAGTAALVPGRYTWCLVGLDTTPPPDASDEVVTGTFVIKDTTYLGS